MDWNERVKRKIKKPILLTLRFACAFGEEMKNKQKIKFDFDWKILGNYRSYEHIKYLSIYNFS